MPSSPLTIFGVFLAAAALALIVYIVLGRRQIAQGRSKYRWKPEQDYDVVLRGETPMTPGFPILVKRPSKQRKEGK